MEGQYFVHGAIENKGDVERVPDEEAAANLLNELMAANR